MAVIVTAIQGLAASFAATSVGTFLTKTFVGRLLSSIALSALKAALTKQPETRQAGIRTQQTQTGGVNPASFILGKYATEGQLICPPMSHGSSGGTPNAYLTYVIELGAKPGQTLDGLILDGEEAPIGETAHEDYGFPIGGRFEGYAWIKYYDGSQTAADPMLIDKYGDYPDRPWTVEMIGTGLCYAIVTFLYNREVFSAFPGLRFVMGGIPLYDPRRDSSVGGMGTHRWDDESTWQQTENLAVLVYNIMRGIDLGGGHIWGGRVPAEDLPLATWWAAMNTADVLIEIEEPPVLDKSEPQYRGGYEVFVDDEPASVIETLMRGSMGKLAEIGGVWKIRLGGPGLPVYFVTDDDIIITEEEVNTPFSAEDEVYNAVHGKYPDPDMLWEPREAPPRYDAALEARDGGQRNAADLNFAGTPYPLQVQRTMLAYLKDDQNFQTDIFTLAPDAMVLEPLDCFSRTSARWGYNAHIFDVEQVEEALLTGTPRVTAREVNPADTVWLRDDQLPTVAVPKTVTPPPLLGVSGFDAGATTIIGANASARAAALLTWNGDQPGVEAVLWEIRLPDDTLVASGSHQDVASGSLKTDAGILSLTTYKARARALARRPTTWSDYVTFTTADHRTALVDLAPAVASDLAKGVTALDGVSQTFPEGFEEDSTHFSTDPNAPDLEGPDLSTDGWTFHDTPEGRVARATANGSGQGISTRGWLRVEVGRTYRATLSYRQTSGPLSIDGVRAQLRTMDGSWATVDTHVVAATPTALNQIATVEVEFTAADTPANQVYLRPRFFIHATAAAIGNVYEFLSCRFADVTQINETGISGTNQIPDPLFQNGLGSYQHAGIGGIHAATTMALRQPPASWAGPDYPTLSLYQSNAAADGYTEVKIVKVSPSDGTVSPLVVPVVEGGWYGFAAQISTHRCAGRLYMFWYDAAGGFLSASEAVIPDNVPSDGLNPEKWPTYFVSDEAPTGAFYMQPVMRSLGTSSGADSYLIAHKLQTFKSHPSVTKAPPWSPPGPVTVFENLMVRGRTVAQGWATFRDRVELAHNIPPPGTTPDYGDGLRGALALQKNDSVLVKFYLSTNPSGGTVRGDWALRISNSLSVLKTLATGSFDTANGQEEVEDVFYVGLRPTVGDQIELNITNTTGGAWDISGHIAIEQDLGADDV